MQQSASDMYRAHVQVGLILKPEGQANIRGRHNDRIRCLVNQARHLGAHVRAHILPAGRRTHVDTTLASRDRLDPSREPDPSTMVWLIISA